MRSRRRVWWLFGILVLTIGGVAAVVLLGLQIPWLEDVEEDDTPGAGVAWGGEIQIEGPYARSVKFVAYTPPAREGERLPLAVYVGGYNARPTWITRGPWAAFADEHRFALLSPLFYSNGIEARGGEGYHYPATWSGEAFEAILAEVRRRAPTVDTEQLYLFGFSAGAQFAHRYALRAINRVRAVFAYAPGSVTPPRGTLVGGPGPRFRFVVGAEDRGRRRLPLAFLDRAKRGHFDADLEIIEGLDHQVTPAVLRRARAFFIETKERLSSPQPDTSKER